MIYIRCPTCGYIIGNRQILYESRMEEINNNPNTDDDIKLELKTKLVESLNLKRYCCKVRVMTFKQLTDIIK
jgi:DNA-directed RNA polymerase subunit N (RpoN/RPB10)